MGILRKIAYVIGVGFLGSIVGGVYGALFSFAPQISVEMAQTTLFPVFYLMGILTVVYVYGRMD